LGLAKSRSWRTSPKNPACPPELFSSAEHSHNIAYYTAYKLELRFRQVWKNGKQMRETGTARSSVAAIPATTTGTKAKQVRFGKQHWQKLASLLKKFATPRSKELQRELSAVRQDYRELGLRASALASEGDLVRKTLGKAKQQIESVHGELGAAYKARDQLAFELQKQLESLKTGIKEVQVGHHGLVKGVAERDRQLETLAADLEAHRSAEQEQQDAINNLQQRVSTAALDYTAVTEKNHTLAADLEDLRNELDSTRNSHLELLTDIKNLEQRTGEAERNDLAAKDHNQALAVELAGIQHEFEDSKNSNSKQLANLELQLGDIEEESGSTRNRLQALENSLTATASRHDDTQQQIKSLEEKLEEERERHQATLNAVEERLTRVQIEQESLINIQSELTDSLRKNRRWATVAVGVAFLIGALAGITKIRVAENPVPEQAAVTDDAKLSLEPRVSQQDTPPQEEPRSLTGETTESAAFETETGPTANEPPSNGTEATTSEASTSNTEPVASEPPSNEQTDAPDPPPENDASAPLKRPLTPSQATVAVQVFEAKKFFEENARQEGVISLPSGLQYKVLRTGSGQSPGLTDMVILHYRGSLPDGREFDSSYAEKAPAAYRVDQVIAGWREALQRMHEGAHWELYIPPELTHNAGTRETPGFLPLIYQIELISVSKAGASQP
jgi:FKBP-type peptidyl-prolyl cis-trans isomerase/predicted  nucleic acid-binding Zn-ribbon protein